MSSTLNDECSVFTEFQIAEMQIDNSILRSLDSTRRMLELCEESQDAGIKTLVMLDEQGEQLDRIEEGNDRINEDMRDAEKNLEGLEKCCGLFVLPWKKTKNMDYKKTIKLDSNNQINSNRHRHAIGMNSSNDTSANFINRIRNDKYENEMDKNISAVSQLIGNLRNMAIDMGNEIAHQTQVINHADIKTHSNYKRTHDAKKRANKLLKI